MNATAMDIQACDPPLAVEEQYDDAVQQREAATLGMWLFLSTEIMFFGVLFASYTICRILYPDGFAEAGRHTDMLLGTIETAVLLTSSSLIAISLRAIKLGQRRACTWLLLGTAALGTAFLVIHGFEYYSEYTEHLIPGINFNQPGPHAHAMELFFCLYYFITGFHSAHVIVGVLLITTLAVRVARGAFSTEQHNTLELAALYWHLVDIVWVFVYPVIYLVGRSG